MSDLSANSVFWLSFATLTFTFLSGALVYTIKSKCSSVKCCGCIEIIRDVELEAEIEEHNMPPNVPRSLSQELTENTGRRNSQIMREIIKHINKKNEEKNEETKDSEVIDFTKSMTI